MTCGHACLPRPRSLPVGECLDVGCISLRIDFHVRSRRTARCERISVIIATIETRAALGYVKRRIAIRAISSVG